MSLTIIKPGLSDTLQDLGRYGYGSLGINRGGAMDTYAAEVANFLTGNCLTEAVLEIHFPGPQILFEQNALIAITGANFSATLDGEYINCWQPIVVRKNTVLQFTQLVHGARAYLSVHGGFAAETWMGSTGTNTKVKAGGWKGRRLQKNDELPFKESTIYYPALLPEKDIFHYLPWRVNCENQYRLPHEIMVVRGNEWDELTVASQTDFYNNNFILHPSSDRMGYQLRSASLNLKNEMDLISSAVSFGTIQLLPNGQLVALMADHQITGGYPRIAHIITAHLPKMAQLRPGDNIQFKTTNLATAEELLYHQQQELQVLKHSCRERLNELLCAELT